jgi:GDP-mannose 6-dehydrogenase
MKIAIFGLGYVGLTGAACLLKEGKSVVGYDVSKSKVDELLNGKCPIFEPGLEELLATGVKEGRFEVGTAIDERLDECDIAMVCVGTPSAADGGHNMGYIAEVSRQIAKSIKKTRKKELTVAFRSTVQPGTIDKLIQPIFETHLGKDLGPVELVYNPEFLRESTAIADYFSPPRIVVGTKDGKPNKNMEALYAGIEAPRFNVKYREAEITKLVDNSFHALKIAFANEIGRICYRQGISAKQVHQIFIADTKLNISPYYTRPGSPFGGSCLPKDVRALTYLSNHSDAYTFVVDSLIRSNAAHKQFMFHYATEGLQPGAKILMNGVSFKANSDDLRESPFLDLASSLLNNGYELQIHDPYVKPENFVGQNLSYAFSHLPNLSDVLVGEDVVKSNTYDRLIDVRGTGPAPFMEVRSVVNVNTIP